MISGGRREGLRSLGYKITSLQGKVVRGMAIDARVRPYICCCRWTYLKDRT
jgi:hypothetical protein